MTLKYKILFAFSVLLIGLIIIIRPYWQFINKTLKVSPIKTLFSIDGLKTYNNHVNILLLGIAGENRDGPNLSDSILVASYNLKTNYLTTISIPRDIWSEALQDKINSAYAYGEAKRKGAGFILAKAEIENIIGQPIHYAAVINFDQFTKLIDFLGGVDIAVENSFIDNEFPIAGKENDLCDNDPEYKCRYETVSFDKGLNHMNGAIALKFVRSRHALGTEGSDFSREKRQQKVIEAIKNKLTIFVKKNNIDQFKKLYVILDELIKRDISNQQVAIIFKNIILKRNFKQDKILLSEGFFVNPEVNSDKYNGLWILAPINDDIKILQKYINCRLNQEKNCEDLKTEGEKNR